MDSAALRAFVAVAEQGSFSRAADSLFLTQSAVSKRIAALEDELRAPLFDRIGRSVHLTEAGAVLLTRARRILAEIEAGRQAIADLGGTVAGRLRLGTSHHIGLHYLPPVLRAFTVSYPAVELDLRFLESEAACEAVERSELELAVVTLPESPAVALATETLWPDPLAFAVGPDHALCQLTPPLAPAMLADQPAILPAPATFTRRIVAAALAPFGVRPHVTLETNYLETIKMMVAVGLGWSVLPRTMLADGELQPLEIAGIDLERRLGLVRRDGRTLGNAARAFRALVRAQRSADRG